MTKKLYQLRAFDVLPACPSRVRSLIIDEVSWRPLSGRTFRVVTDDGVEFETTLHGLQAHDVEVEG